MNYINDIRRDQFLQLKKEIRDSTEHLIVGLDVAKERHNAFFGTATGRTQHKGMFFDKTYEGFQKLPSSPSAAASEKRCPSRPRSWLRLFTKSGKRS
jgi:hypothetical protein